MRRGAVLIPSTVGVTDGSTRLFQDLVDGTLGLARGVFKVRASRRSARVMSAFAELNRALDLFAEATFNAPDHEPVGGHRPARQP